MLNVNVIDVHRNNVNTKPKVQAKELGQFFTEQEVSDYMASMIHKINVSGQINYLDAGAGTGILTSSAALYCLNMGYKDFHASLYEIDEDLLPTLKENMNRIKWHFQQRKAKFTYRIFNEDFIISRPAKNNFHLSIINPPYFKYNSKGSVYSGATEDLFKGNPNIYASFMAVVSSCLQDDGQMIAIVPRSFTNGLYFKGFREYLNQSMSLERIHIFRARNRLFKNMNVLQENIICKLVKRKQKGEISIHSSTCTADLNNTETNIYPRELIIEDSDKHNIIRIPENSTEGHILKTVEHWPGSFVDNGYYISTGPVVEHRTREYITTENKKNSVPLLRMHNIKPLKIEWTGKNRKDARFILKNGHEKHTSKNSIYVLLKRFSSKDEKRRLTSGVHDPFTIKSKTIALENHLNYIGVVNDDMEIDEAYGLSALFNSTFMDRYFRAISGNTQVNATEIRFLKLPSRKTIVEIGKKVQKTKELGQETIDKIVRTTLKV